MPSRPWICCKSKKPRFARCILHFRASRDAVALLGFALNFRASRDAAALLGFALFLKTVAAVTTSDSESEIKCACPKEFS